MRTLAPSIVFALVAASPALAGGAAAKKSASARPEAVTVHAADITWTAAPPMLPKGGQMAVLHGDPMKKGIFTLRFKMPAGYKVPPHWHTNDEQLTVMSGDLLLRMGDTMDAPAQDLTAGSYHFLPARMHHAAEAQNEVIVQIDGMGPFDIHYVNPADNPQKSASR